MRTKARQTENGPAKPQRVPSLSSPELHHLALTCCCFPPSRPSFASARPQQPPSTDPIPAPIPSAAALSAQSAALHRQSRLSASAASRSPPVFWTPAAVRSHGCRSNPTLARPRWPPLHESLIHNADIPARQSLLIAWIGNVLRASSPCVGPSCLSLHPQASPRHLSPQARRAPSTIAAAMASPNAARDVIRRCVECRGSRILCCLLTNLLRSS